MKRFAIGTACLSLLLCALPAWAVVVELTNGQRIEGVLRQASAVRIQLESGGQTLVFDADEVRAIYFNDADPVPAPAPPAIPAPPDDRAPDPAQVLAVVKALHSAVDRGTNRRDYSPRVSRTQAVVDRYLASSPEVPPPGGVALGEAMRFYQLADFAWNNRGVASSIVWLQKDDTLGRCPSYRDFVEEMQAKGERHYSDRTRSFVQISDAVLDVLWLCAAERIAEAEQAIPKPVASKPGVSPKAEAARPAGGAATEASRPTTAPAAATTPTAAASSATAPNAAALSSPSATASSAEAARPGSAAQAEPPKGEASGPPPSTTSERR